MLTFSLLSLLAYVWPIALTSSPSHAMSSNDAARPTHTVLPLSAVHVDGLMPRAVTSFGGAASNGYLYVLGGYFGTPHEYCREDQSGDFLRRSLTDDQWELLPSPGKIQGASLVAHDGRLYRVGGMEIHNERHADARLASTDRFECFDPATGAWEVLPALPQRRSSHMAAVAGDRLFVCGGWTLSLPDEEGNDVEETWHDTFLSLDLNDPEAGWLESPAPFQRRALGVCATDDHVVVLGGFDAETGISRAVNVLDVRSGAWSQGPDFPEQAFGLSAVAIGDAVFASAGDGTLFRWTVGTEDWEPMAAWVFPRFFHQLVVTGDDAITALGGVARGGRIRHVETVRLTPDAAPTASVHTWRLPAHDVGKNRQGMFLKDHALYVFGGNRTLKYHDFRPESFAATNLRLDLATLTWSPKEPLPNARQSQVGYVDAGGEAAYAMGGFGPADGGARTQGEILRYDFKYDTWTPVEASMDLPRSQFALVENGDALLAIGGMDFDPRRNDDDQLRFVTELARWSRDEERSFEPTGVSLPRLRRGSGVAVLDGTCYLVGGMTEDFTPIEAADAYDLEADAWSTIPAPHRARISPELVVLGSKLYLLGGASDQGEGGLTPDPTVEVFDPETGTWTVLVEELPIAIKHMRAMALGDRLLVFSAHQDEDVVELALISPPETLRSERDVARHIFR